MSQVLVIVPSEWVPLNLDQMIGLTGLTLQAFTDLQGRSMTDLNNTLRTAGWLPAGKRVLDVLVVNDQLFFKFEDEDIV